MMGEAELVAVPDGYDTIFKLEFEDPALAHIQVRTRLSYGLVDSAGALVAVDLDAIRAGRAGPEDLARLRTLVADFAGALVSWNLKGDDGRPLGTDVDTVRSLDMTFVLALVGAFMTAVQQMSKQVQAELRAAEQAAQVGEADLPMQLLG